MQDQGQLTWTKGKQGCQPVFQNPPPTPGAEGNMFSANGEQLFKQSCSSPQPS